MRWSWVLGVALAYATDKFLIVSSPSEGTIYYAHVGPNGPPRDLDPRSYKQLETQTLITTGGTPMGIAVYGWTLFVADPTARTISVMPLTVGTTLTAGKPRVLMRNVGARWIAVDGFGNLFYTDEKSSKVLKLSPAEMQKQTPAAKVMYAAPDIQHVSKPGGIAADNLYVYWTNKISGVANGAVVKAVESPPLADVQSAVAPLAKNVFSAMGVCTAQSNVFYTDKKNIFAVKKSGSGVALISSDLEDPRGCSWDEDGTIYVAASGNSAIYAFPGNMKTLHAVKHMVQVATVPKPFDIAVLSSRSFVLLTLGVLLSIL